MSRLNRIIRSGAALVLLAAAACETPTIPARTTAYNFVTPEGIIYRWSDGASIGVYVVPTSDPARAGLLEAALRQGADAWNDASLFGEFEIVTSDLDEADVVLAWANETLPLNTAGCPPAPGGVAWTTFCLDDGVTVDEVLSSPTTMRAVYGYPLTDGEHREDGVHMIVEVLYNASNTDQVAGLVAHELGHVLGIGRHPCDYDDASCDRGYGAFESLMYVGIPERSTPARADRETVELLYRTRPHLVP